MWPCVSQCPACSCANGQDRLPFSCFKSMLLCSISLTKHHRLSGFNNRQLFSHSSGGFRSEIKVPSWLVYDQISLPGLQMASFSPGPCVALPLCVSERELPDPSALSCRDVSAVLWPHWSWITPLGASSPNTVTWGLQLQHKSFGTHSSVYNKG